MPTFSDQTDHIFDLREQQRQLSLDGFSIVDTPPEAVFDDLTWMASKYFDMPISMISLIDQGRQWCKSRVGVDFVQMPRDVSLCGAAIAMSDVMVLEDVDIDSKYAKKPFVLCEHGIQS